MSDVLEVGRHYRNSTGGYEVQAIDGMWATVRYENGTVKRHLLAALQIHWENDQAGAEAAAVASRKAAKPARPRAAKPATPFPAEETNALIADIVRARSAEGRYVTRQTIVEALLADANGRRLIDAAHKALFYRSEEWIAGSMIDQFGKDISRKGSAVRDQFDREQIDNVWAYRPR